MSDSFAPTSIGELSADTAAVAVPSRAVATTDRQAFRIGKLQLAVSFEAASELAELPTIYRIPGTAKAILGVVNLHGNVVPVFDLHTYFGESHIPGERTLLLVLGRGVRAAAIMIDGLPKRKKFLPEEAISRDALIPVLHDFSIGAWAQADGFWCDFAHEALLETLSRG